MPYRFLGPVWRRLPQRVRRWLIRLTQPTFTASAAAVVRNAEGKVLLLDHVLRPSSGWGLPGGFLAAGEQPEKAIRREISEETGIKLEDLRMLRIRVFDEHIEMLFSAETRDTPEVKSREITGLGWFTLEDMPEGVPRGQREIIERVLKGDV